MKYFPVFLVQRSQFRATGFDVRNFNGRFMLCMNGSVLQDVLSANKEEEFNCVVSVSLNSAFLKVFKPILAEMANREDSSWLSVNSCRVLSEQLNGSEQVMLHMNPNMALAFLGMMGRGQDLMYEFEVNWRGAEILCDVLRKSSNTNAQAIAIRLGCLMDEAKERRHNWEEVDDEPLPKGYIS